MAGDSLITSDGIDVGHMTKIARREDGALCGVCGRASHMRAALAWFMAGEPEGGKPKIDGNSAQIAIVRPDGAVEWHDDAGFNVTEAPFFAMGSGRDIAMGAMAAGASAEEAVRIAVKFDTATGGPIRVVSRITD